MDTQTKSVRLDRALVEKYLKPGPRYTSYPTALQFTDVSDPASLLAACAEKRGPLSLYFHLPFCESLCWFCACSKEITKDTTKADRYLDYLEKELDLFLPHLGTNRTVGQIHYGGGSPSFLTAEQIERLGRLWSERFELTDDAELSVEIDPRTLTEEKVAAFQKTGFRRASFGVQDIHPSVQKAVHRIQPSSMNRQAIGWLREAGFESINVDLIYGLPLQTLDSFVDTIDEVLTYSPDRLAIFSYAHVPWVAPAQKILEWSSLPSAGTKLSILEMLIERLTVSNYHYIGMDHFARPDDELAIAQRKGTLHRNFQGYSTRAGLSLAGFGMSSISQTQGTFRQNAKTLEAYEKALDENRLPIERGYHLSEEDKIRRAVIMEIMCHGRLNYAGQSKRLGINFKEVFAPEIASLADMEADGLLSLDDDGLSVLGPGWILIRNIAMQFDAYLCPAEKRHAQTI